MDGKSDKFWTITIDAKQHTVNFGRRGTAGQTQAKDFTTLEAAKAAFEKLIGEKLKKGYIECRAAGNRSVPAAAKRPKAAAQPKPAHTALQAQAETPQETKAPIDLSPTDWMIATWRPRTVQPKPPSRPFDREAAMQLVGRWIESARKKHWGWHGYVEWGDVDLPAQMLPEEARFWFHTILILRQSFYDLSKPSQPDLQIAQLIAQLDITQELPLSQASKMLTEAPHGGLCSLSMIPLLNLYPVKNVAKTIAEAAAHSPWLNIGDRCFRDKALQYLSVNDHAFLREAVRAEMATAAWPAVSRERPRYIFRLAAFLGVGDQLTRVVEAWPADLFANAGSQYKVPQQVVFGLPGSALVSTHMRRLNLRLSAPSHILGWLAHTELAELDLVRDSILAETNRDDAAELVAAFSRAVSAPAAAPVMLACMLNSKAPQPAREWLIQHPAETAAGLAPIAAGKGKQAEGAIEVLRDLHRAGHAAILESQLPPEVLQRVAARAPELPILHGAKLPAGLAAAFSEAQSLKAKLPSWALPAILPPIVTSTGRLNGDHVTTALIAIAKSDVALPHPLLLALRCYATPASLDAFAWSLFERWLRNGAPAKEKWALSAVGLFGGDESAIRLASMIREWPGQGKHQTAVLGLECLRSIGSETALVQINGIAQKVKFQAIKARAQECMEAIASDLSLTREQLEDRLVPDCGLDEHGSRIFDFGPRQFRLVLGSGLKPLVADAANQRKPDLPKPNSKDDAAKAQQATAAWKLVKKQLTEVIKVQTRRMEQALVTQRRWAAADFDRIFVRHPFLVNLAQCFVWGVYGANGKPASTFRVTEDRSLGDEHDASVTLPSDAAIGLVHPIYLDPSSLAAWGELLSDYEILPPFPQLGRPVLALSDAERRGDAIQRHGGVSIPATSLAGTLERLGWQRAAPADAGGYDNHGKHFPTAGITAVVQHDSLYIGSLADSADTPIHACYFTSGAYDRAGWADGLAKIPLNSIDPLIVSEVLSDLQTLASKGTK